MMIRLLDHLPQPLTADVFSYSNWQSIRQLAASLPPLSGGGMEIHLNATMPRSDLMMRATSSDHGREVLAALHSQWRIPAAWLQCECWQKIQCFGRQWANPNSALYTAIENVWLEFDILPDKSAAANVTTYPSIFFDLDRHRRLSNVARCSALKLALASFNHELPENFFATLQSISNKATSDSYLYYTGLMLSRSEPAVRVCLAGLNVDTIFPVLQSIGYEGHLHHLQSVMDNHANAADRLVLQLDIGTDMGSRIGIEIFKAENNWPAFFTNMVSTGSCTRSEARRILNWPGNLPLTDEHFRASLSRVMKRDVSQLIKRINHVKFVSAESGEIATKAYLYFGYH